MPNQPALRTGHALAEVALAAAQEAAELVLAGFRGPQRVELKAGNEPFTEFDLASESLLRARLRAETPEIPIVGEEQGGEPSSGLTWYCDPIDGTVNFMRGQPIFAVSVGVAEGARPVAGAVVAPALGVSWHGSPRAAGGRGAFRNGKPCSCSSNDRLESAVVSAGLPLRGSAARDTARWLGTLAEHCRDLRRCGSAAIELCLVSDGSYDAYWARSLQLWDTCAGAAIAQAAGAVWKAGIGPRGGFDVCCVPGIDPALSALLARLS